MERPQTHSKTIGYLLWIFGFTGAHRFYFGRPVTGTIWLLTGGLVGVGWIVDHWGWNWVFIVMGACSVLTMAFSALTLGHKAESSTSHS